MTDSLTHLNAAQLEALQSDLAAALAAVADRHMTLDLSRGKPSADQLSLSDGLEDTIRGDYLAADGTDTRNYGGLRGLPEARALGSELLGMPVDRIIAGGNSSLFFMHLCVTTALQQGLWSDARCWQRTGQPKLLAPVPGYDRHFALSETLGLELVNIPMLDDGPDLQRARQLAAADPSIKGIWCVPKYSNPTGCVYADATVQALAKLPAEAAADDFVVLWDNAYAVHDLSANAPTLASIGAAADAMGTADHIVQFASTSKMTFAGGGVAFLAASEPVLTTIERVMGCMMIGPDKVNQLRHARFLRGRVRAHMQAHAEILAPKFKLVEDTLQAELGGLDIARWTRPAGGYFVSLDLLPGLARTVVDMAKAVGLTLTPAGATFPAGHDPEDRNVRIAPTFASLEELAAAMQTLTLCVKLASVRQLLART